MDLIFKRILLIEDYDGVIVVWRKLVEKLNADHSKTHRIELIVATTHDECRRALEENLPFDVVFIDGDLGNGHGSTIPLVPEIKRVFHGPLVTASGNPKSVEELKDAGCNVVADNKNHAMDLAAILLQLPK